MNNFLQDYGFEAAIVFFGLFTATLYLLVRKQQKQ